MPKDPDLARELPGARRGGPPADLSTPYPQGIARSSRRPTGTRHLGRPGPLGLRVKETLGPAGAGRCQCHRRGRIRRPSDLRVMSHCRHSDGVTSTCASRNDHIDSFLENNYSYKILKYIRSFCTADVSSPPRTLAYHSTVATSSSS
jgi:hypothetical protein